MATRRSISLVERAVDDAHRALADAIDDRGSGRSFRAAPRRRRVHRLDRRLRRQLASYRTTTAVTLSRAPASSAGVDQRGRRCRPASPSCREHAQQRRDRPARRAGRRGTAAACRRRELVLGRRESFVGVARAEDVGEHVPHRVVGERFGSCLARSARIVAAHVSSCVSCASEPPRQEVQPAVADVPDRRSCAGDQRADDRRAHAGVVVVTLGGAEDAAVGQVDRRAQPIASKRQRRIDAVRPRDVRLLLPSGG